MRKLLLITFISVVSFMASSQTKVTLTVEGNSMTATLVENEATRELKELLEKGPISIQMSDYGGFEKVGALPQSFTTSNTQITTEPGDIMLYQGCNMVIFYGSNSWSYTRLGKIDGADSGNIKQFLGTGDISLTLSLVPPSGIEEISAERDSEDAIYDLKGNRLTNVPHKSSIYIINGKKIYK